jgi:hypothetical protein
MVMAVARARWAVGANRMRMSKREQIEMLLDCGESTFAAANDQWSAACNATPGSVPRVRVRRPDVGAHEVEDGCGVTVDRWRQLSFDYVDPPEVQEARERARNAPVYAPAPGWRPVTRADCAQVPRPCPYVSCSQHNYLDVIASDSNRAPRIRLNHPGLEPHEMVDSCALDVAERGEHTLEEVAEATGMSPQRVDQISAAALVTLRTPAAHIRAVVGGSNEPSMRVRVEMTFSTSTASGQPYLTVEDLHRVLGIDERKAKRQVYREVRAMVSEGYLLHDSGREGRRMYWLARP